MVVGAPERDVLKIGVHKYTGDTAITSDAGVRMEGSAVRKRTMNGGVIGKRMDWVRGWAQVLNSGER